MSLGQSFCTSSGLRFAIEVLVILISLASLPNSIPTLATGSQTNNTKLSAILKSVDPCVTQSVYSYIYPQSRPPTSVSQLVSICKAQSEAYKCLRERSRVAPALIKRGLASLVATRQRHSKKYCTNPAGELSKKFLDANRCVSEKKPLAYEEIDSRFAHTLIAIKAANFNSSAVELNQLCCAVYSWRKNLLAQTELDCPKHKEIIEEMLSSIVSSEINLICEDEEKLSVKVCPKLEPLQKIKKGKFPIESESSPSINVLYLIATLGEQDT